MILSNLSVIMVGLGTDRITWVQLRWSSVCSSGRESGDDVYLGSQEPINSEFATSAYFIA
jgi:hypothetical protein